MQVVLDAQKRGAKEAVGRCQLVACISILAVLSVQGAVANGKAAIEVFAAVQLDAQLQGACVGRMRCLQVTPVLVYAKAAMYKRKRLLCLKRELIL